MKTTFRLLLAASFAAGVTLAAEGPKMPPPAGGGGTGVQPRQPTPEQIKQAERDHHRKNTKPRKGNEQQPFGGGKKDKEKDEELEVSGVLEKKTGSPGEPEVFTIKGGEGTTYTLDGKETTLRRLVGKTVEIEGERDEKTGALKVKSVREAKASTKEKKT